MKARTRTISRAALREWVHQQLPGLAIDAFQRAAVDALKPRFTLHFDSGLEAVRVRWVPRAGIYSIRVPQKLMSQPLSELRLQLVRKLDSAFARHAKREGWAGVPRLSERPLELRKHQDAA